MNDIDDFKSQLLAVLDAPEAVSADEAMRRSRKRPTTSAAFSTHPRSRLPRRTALAWVAAIVLLVAILIGFRVASSGRPSKPVNHGPAPGVSLTPKGWVPVDYGNLQISVPASWSEVRTCTSEHGFISVGNGIPSGCVVGPNSNGTLEAVAIGVWQGPLGDGHKVVINGITTYELGNSIVPALINTFYIPSLGAQMKLVGALSSRVVQTITHSPRAYVLGTGQTPGIPANWHKVAYSGLSFEVPLTWPVQSVNYTAADVCLPAPTLGYPPSVAEFTGRPPIINCVETQAGSFNLSAPNDGLAVEPGGPVEGSATFGNCESVNGLSACPITPGTGLSAEDYSGYLLLKVTVPGISHPVAVEIGLGGNGTIARTILYSMRPAPATNSTIPSTLPPTTTTTVALGDTPVLPIDGYTGREPSTIAFSGDAGDIFRNISWASWTQTEAVGYGISNYDNCIPYCAAGKVTPEATSVVVSQPFNGRFTKIVEFRMGSSETFIWPGHYPALWPQWATAPSS